MMVKHNKRANRLTLFVEIILTLAICVGIIWTSMMGLATEAGNYAAEVTADYKTLTTNYIRAFKILKMEAVNKIKENPSFEDMQEWLQSKELDFQEAIGKDIYDGFAFTYKGSYAHSWNYGDYSEYDPNTRPWYQKAGAAKGDVVVVAPYVTYLSGTDIIEQYDILRMSIAQKYNNDISFDFDLKVDEINNLVTDRNTIYSGTIVFLYDKDGYILSSTDSDYYGHNVNTTDSQISERLSETLVDREKNEYGIKLVHVNKDLKQIYRYTDIEGKTICILVPFSQVFIRNFLFVVLLAGVLITIEILFYHRNETHLTILEKNKQVLKDALEHAENASHAKGDFMSHMSHEIRTPLNAIIGYLDMAHDELEDKEKTEHCIEKSQMASKHLLSIINDVLDISSIESGKMKIAHEKFDIKQMVNSLTTLFYAQAKSKNIEFGVKIKKLDTEYVSGDELRVRQVLLNLLSNAVKFTDEGGKVLLGISQVGEMTDKIHIEFTVQDTGIGMSEEYKNRMFTPFEQEKVTTAKNYGGTGLGLSICNNLVHMMGGKIDVKSIQGEGTTFIVVLAFDVVKTEKNQLLEKTDFSHIKVLVADDDQDTCEYMKKILQRMDVTCDIVNSGKKAIRRVKDRISTDEPYDLCILDWHMNDMDGMETAKQLRNICGRKLPIIIATAYDTTNLIEEAKEIGIDKIVLKPLFQSSLFDLLVNTYGGYKTEHIKEKNNYDFTGKNIMLAEDNEMNMEIAMNILEKSGLKITPVVNGKEAYDLFEKSDEGTFDAILMDIQMPIMDGYAATRKIRESSHPDAKKIPIIAMTANAFTEDVTAALAAGMNDHVSKPISYDRLFEVLGRLMEKNKKYNC